MQWGVGKGAEMCEAQFVAYDEEVNKAENEADDGGYGHGDANHHHICRRQRAKEIGQGNAHAECGQQPLYHNKAGFSEPVEISEHTERNRNEDIFKRTTFEIKRGGGYNVCVGAENRREQVTAEEGKEEHCRAESERHRACRKQGFGRSRKIAAPFVLSNESGERRQK